MTPWKSSNSLLLLRRLQDGATDLHPFDLIAAEGRRQPPADQDRDRRVVLGDRLTHDATTAPEGQRDVYLIAGRTVADPAEPAHRLSAFTASATKPTRIPATQSMMQISRNGMRVRLRPLPSVLDVCSITRQKGRAGSPPWGRRRD